MSIVDRYNRRVDAVNSLLCVGLDSDVERLPDAFRREVFPQFAFNRWIIEQTNKYASAYKPNLAFYEARGDGGLRELKMTVEYLREHHPHIFVIGDAKRADVASTNAGYVTALFDWLDFDAVTLNPYLGREALQPFLDRADRGCIVLCRTSNPGAGEVQDLRVDDKPLWQIVAQKVSEEWNANDNCMLVVGATYPQELQQVRALVGDMTILVPGVGTQGGEVSDVVSAGINASGKGLIINAGRSILFSGDPAGAAQAVRDAINLHRAGT